MSQAGAPRREAPGARRSARVLVVLALLAGCSTDPGTVGAPDVSKLADPAPSSAPTDAVPIRSGALPAAPVVAPIELEIPALSLAARVDRVGIDPVTDDLAVPPGIDVVGWYRHGPGLAASAGSIVIAGHVDSAELGEGAFFRLRELAPGDRVSVRGDDGAVRMFEVVGREIYPKSSIPLEKYFARDGAVRLTLITCGGPFDARTRHYRDNVVITAQPVSR